MVKLNHCYLSCDFAQSPDSMTTLLYVIGHDDGGFCTGEHHTKSAVGYILQPLRLNQPCQRKTNRLNSFQIRSPPKILECQSQFFYFLLYTKDICFETKHRRPYFLISYPVMTFWCVEVWIFCHRAHNFLGSKNIRTFSSVTIAHKRMSRLHLTWRLADNRGYFFQRVEQAKEGGKRPPDQGKRQRN